MDPQQQPHAHQQQVQSGAWAPMYGATFMNHCMHPQLQQLADAQWKLEVAAKLAAVLEKLRERFAKSQNVCLCQTWVGSDGCETSNPTSLEVTLWADPRLAIVLDPLFQELRNKSCQGPVFFRNSMPGKVWQSGAVQIVQNLRILPPTLHPRSQLSEEALERLAEALYIPIYDLGRPAKGQVCVLEVLLSTRATEAMLVADVISFIGSLLSALHLSLANPVQQPVRRSVLCGRRARAPDSDDGEASGGDGEAGGSTRSKVPPPPSSQGPLPQCQAPSQHQQHQQQQQQQQHSGVAAQGTADASHHGTCQSTVAAGTAGAPASGAQLFHRPPDHSRPVAAGWDTGVPGCVGTPPAGAQHQHARPAVAGAGGSVQSPADAPQPSLTAGSGLGGAADCREVSLDGAAPRGDVVPVAGPAEVPGPRSRDEGPLPACSEQPTLPASPSHDRAAARGGLDGAAGEVPGAQGPSKCVSGGSTVVPRKVRRLLDGPMQRTKSVVSVAALSDGIAPEDEEEEEGDGDVPLADGQAPFGQQGSEQAADAA